MSVYPEGLGSAIGKFLGMQDIEAGSPSFDGEFVAKSNIEALARDILMQLDVQDALLRLKRLRGNGQVSLDVEGGRMRIRKLSYIEDDGSMREFLSCCLRVHARLRGAGFESPPGR